MTSVGTFNIRLFPDRDTRPADVAERLTELDADVVMVQEIRDPSALHAMLDGIAAVGGRRYGVSLGPMCRTSELRLGVLFDRARYALVQQRPQKELDPEGRCSCRDGHPPALLAVLERADGIRLGAMSVHLLFGARSWQFCARRGQWEQLVASIDRLVQELQIPLVVGGDFNSTGYAEDDLGERTFIEQTVADAGLTLATAGLRCTAYWRPNRRLKDYVPSMLDHVLVSGAAVSGAEVLGMCATLAGRTCPGDEANPDFHHVSDHCPVRVDIAL